MQSSKSDKSPSVGSLFSLKGRVAVVIGGAGLLGSEITLALAELGADIIIASRDKDKNIEFVRELEANFEGLNAKAAYVDITNDNSVRELMNQVDIWNPAGFDILVNSGWSGRKNNFDSISIEDWQNDLDVCLTGVFRTIKAAVPLLKKKNGNILNIASMYGHIAPDYRVYDDERYANPPSYGAAKAGVIQLTKYLASFLSSHGIRVNCISPGPFPFEVTQIENPEFMERLSGKNPLNRLGKPHEIKGAASLLCSDAGSYMTGQNLCVDGGWSIW